jgi:microcystin-dependent protein
MRSGATPMTGPLKAVDGSSGSPGVQFGSAASTGLYKTASGIGVAVGGTKVAEFGAGGLIGGARFIGELIPFTGSTAPALTVLPFGQTLNRADYPDLWAFAQSEIAAGNTSFNNGNGTTTFGILDARGRVPVAWDKMGGTAAGLVTTAGSGVDGTVIGAKGGAETHTLTTTQLASHQHNAFINDPQHAHTGTIPFTVSGNISAGGGPNLTAALVSQALTIQNAATGVRVWDGVNMDRTSLAGGGAAHNNMQPSLVCNFLLFAGA